MRIIRKILLVAFGLLIGISIGYFAISHTPLFALQQKEKLLSPLGLQKKEIIGFLPYWLTQKAKSDYSKYITTLSYFSLTIDTDGHIKKLVNPQEEEPGWTSLRSRKLDEFLKNALEHGITLSLVLFSSDEETINKLLQDPVVNGDNLSTQVIPLMQKYKFSDLNLDIESTKEASNDARARFTAFVKEVKNNLSNAHVGTLTIDITGDALVKKQLINAKDIAQIADRVVIMGYDYHYTGSYVSGPVAPLEGAGTIAEYDVATAVQEALSFMPPQKIILGMPLYGYEWETIGNTSHSAVIPYTGVIASSKRVQKFISDCGTCSAQFDSDAKEAYLIYQDQQTNTFHQVFYPDKRSTLAKVNFVREEKLAGLALWALGFEDESVLLPLEAYK